MGRFIQDYHPDDQIKSRTDANNITLSYQYDDLNRLTQIRKNDQRVLVSFHYDETVDGQEQKGFLTSMEDESGSTVYLHNIHGELVQETRTTSGHVFVTKYQYNDNGEPASIVYPSGRRIIYNRTPAGQLDSIESV